MYKYKTLGIKISSEIQIPELEKSEVKCPDVRIEYGKLESPNLKSENEFSKTIRDKNGFLCYIKGEGGVRVCDKSKIIVSPENGSEKRGFRFLVSGIGLGLLLHLRGFVTLHASAVAVQDRVIAFIGQKGMGKSTTAAALHAQGYPVVTDDLLVLDTANDCVRAYPGFPYLKLTPESIAESVNENPDRIPKIDPGGPKHSFEAEGTFAKDTLSVGCIYVLDYQEEREEGKKPALPYSREIEGKEAFIELVRNSYVARLLPEEAVSKRHLEHSAEIAQAVSVRRLYRKPSLEHLPELVSHIEQAQHIEQDHHPGDRTSDNRSTFSVQHEREEG